MGNCPLGVVTIAAAGKHDDVFVEHSAMLFWSLAEMPATSSVSHHSCRHMASSETLKKAQPDIT